MFDKDLISRQSVRDQVKKCQEAWRVYKYFSQAEVDRVVKSMHEAALLYSENLAKMAVEETGMGIYEHKVQKNLFASREVYEYIKHIKTVGVIREEPTRGVLEIATPLGVIAGITPTTNPTSTIIYKSLISLKARNGIVFCPHPGAQNCSSETVKILQEAAVKAGAPENLIGCVSPSTLEGSKELMKHPDVALILATGGSGMVREAYSSGRPALGVGPGNVPVFIERSADVKKAVSDIFLSKTFDNGVICSSEQSLIVERPILEETLREIIALGGYFLSANEVEAVSKVVILPTGGMSPRVVGQTALKIASIAGINVPENTRLLLAPLMGVGENYPLSREKLCPVLAFYVAENWQEGCERCYQILIFGGMGRTLSIHSTNDEVIHRFAEEKPAFRIVVNTPSSQGAIGLTTGLVPALTLSCGTLGGSYTSDNIAPWHLMQVRRLAYDQRNKFESEDSLKELITQIVIKHLKKGDK